MKIMIVISIFSQGATAIDRVTGFNVRSNEKYAKNAITIDKKLSAACGAMTLKARTHDTRGPTDTGLI